MLFYSLTGTKELVVNYEEILDKIPIASRQIVEDAINDASSIADSLLDLPESDIDNKFLDSVHPFWTKIITINYVLLNHVNWGEFDLLSKEIEIYSSFEKYVRAKEGVLEKEEIQQLHDLFSVLLEYDTTILDIASKISNAANYLISKIDFTELNYSLSASLLALVCSMHGILEPKERRTHNARIILSHCKTYVDTVESFVDTIQILGNSEELAILQNSLHDIEQGRISEVR